MYLKSIEIAGFKSFAKKDEFQFTSAISGIVGPNGSGKSNVAEAFRFVLGEQSMKSLRGKRGEDLIFNGSPTMPRSNRAVVKVVFNNTKRLLDIDFDEVTIERTVHRDGVNQYAINGSQVRLRDVIELLAGANVGSSGHHIISQGEADRILNASMKERREMVEDALGLKVYQYKKQESEKKLFKTQENIKQVTSLQKEVSPHLKFLERQVEKINKTLSMREDLKERYLEYLKREDVYLSFYEDKIKKDKAGPEEKLVLLGEELSKAKKVLEQEKNSGEKGKEIIDLEESLATSRRERDELSRALGKTEGQVAFEEAKIEDIKKKKEEGRDAVIPLTRVREVFSNVTSEIEKVGISTDAEDYKLAFEQIKKYIKEFLYSGEGDDEMREEDEIDTQRLEELKGEKAELEEKMEKLKENERSLQETYRSLRSEIEAAKDESREAEREVFRIMTEQGGLRNTIDKITNFEDRLHRDREEFEREISEGIALIGHAIKEYTNTNITKLFGGDVGEEDLATEDRGKQENRRRDIEKIKIRLEEAGSGNSEEIMKEYKDVKERNEFLERELADLDKSAESLRELIVELEEKLDKQFKEGVGYINKAFQKFFEILFDGGSAKLDVVKQTKKKRIADELLGGEEVADDEEDIFEGLEVDVKLPHKRVRGLEMLSGGERALASIALIFAMSQVNPPPFIILDETDAALDEANSKRYGDMIENLAKKSQLVLITHNRETMSRAGLLYGITMGSNGVSRVLSVKLEDAMKVAK